MNKRINELAEQAGFTEGRYESDDGPWIESEFNKEKFAELIVKECARVVDNLTEQDNPIEYRRTYAQGADVLEHFGVEA